MKKLSIIMLMLLAVLAVGAQKWQKTFENGDELTGVPEHTAYTWKNNEGQRFVFYSFGKQWEIISEQTCFSIDPTHLNKRNNFVTYVTIGFYDADNNLIESFNGCTVDVVNLYRVAVFLDKRGKGSSKVADFLRNEKGYVRILANGMNGNVNVKVPCLNNETE